MKKKTLAYVIGGEARLVAETYKQDEIYKQLCEKYKVHTYIHSWTQLGKWTKDNEKYRFGDGTRPQTSEATKYYPPDWKIVQNNKETIVYTSGYGGLFKSGLPVGKMKHDKNLNKNKINFFSDFKQLDYVKIVSFEMENKK